jgi:hypothetical protein
MVRFIVWTVPVESVQEQLPVPELTICVSVIGSVPPIVPPSCEEPPSDPSHALLIVGWLASAAQVAPWGRLITSVELVGTLTFWFPGIAVIVVVALAPVPLVVAAMAWLAKNAS